MSRPASGAATRALSDLPQVQVVNASVRNVVSALTERPDVAVLDPPRRGAGKDVITLLAQAEVPRVIHIGCEVASFARDVGLYLQHGFAVDDLRVFDAFPLTHHTEAIALLSRTGEMATSLN
jgi:tRNA/tmRNA/rRNA uracil-C5-methylase (TrmA/RlmC/RlmD family)